MQPMAPDVFDAIADPTRRQILRLLAGEDLPVQALSAEFPISRPAISKHLRVLRESGLVTERKVGRRRYYQLQPAALREVGEWVAYFDRYWQERLDALRAHVEGE